MSFPNPSNGHTYGTPPTITITPSTPQNQNQTPTASSSPSSYSNSYSSQPPQPSSSSSAAAGPRPRIFSSPLGPLHSAAGGPMSMATSRSISNPNPSHGLGSSSSNAPGYTSSGTATGSSHFPTSSTPISIQVNNNNGNGHPIVLPASSEQRSGGGFLSRSPILSAFNWLIWGESSSSSNAGGEFGNDGRRMMSSTEVAVANLNARIERMRREEGWRREMMMRREEQERQGGQGQQGGQHQHQQQRSWAVDEELARPQPETQLQSPIMSIPISGSAAESVLSLHGLNGSLVHLEDQNRDQNQNQNQSRRLGEGQMAVIPGRESIDSLRDGTSGGRPSIEANAFALGGICPNGLTFLPSDSLESVITNANNNEGEDSDSSSSSSSSSANTPTMQPAVLPSAPLSGTDLPPYTTNNPSVPSPTAPTTAGSDSQFQFPDLPPTFQPGLIRHCSVLLNHSRSFSSSSMDSNRSLDSINRNSPPPSFNAAIASGGRANHRFNSNSGEDEGVAYPNTPHLPSHSTSSLPPYIFTSPTHPLPSQSMPGSFPFVDGPDGLTPEERIGWVEWALDLLEVERKREEIRRIWEKDWFMEREFRRVGL